MSAVRTGYAECSWLDKVKLGAVALQIPVVAVWALLTSPFKSEASRKSWKRVIGDSAFRFLTDSLQVKQLQLAFGPSTRSVVEKWCQSNNLPVVVEELGEDSRLFWIGPKRSDKVILYLHGKQLIERSRVEILTVEIVGGAFLIPAQDFTLSFWNHAKGELQKSGQDVGFALLNYTLVPNGIFPLQLKQTCLAIQRIIDSGVSPQNLQIVGDSAGGNLILQVLSHMLHPCEGVPPLSLQSPIRGAFMLSPWVSLTSDPREHSMNNKTDTLSAKCLGEWGAEVLRDVPASGIPYLEAKKTPGDWFKSVGSCVERTLITAGGAEALRDDIIDFKEAFEVHHPDVKFVLQEGGVHDDPFNDFMLGKPKKVGDLTMLIIEWLAAGFDASS